MPTSAGSSISLSSAHIYTLERDPNKSPPTRSNHLPISSQTSPSSPSSSSPAAKRPSSSNEVDRNITEMILDPIDDDDDDDEFQGLEMIGNTQWEKEVPNFEHRSKKRKITASSSSSHPSSPLQKVDQEHEDWNAQEEIDELDESDWDIPFDLIQSQEEDQTRKEGVEQVALHSPIAGLSSPPMRTPAFSLPSINSDIPSGPYPQTPQTHNREFNHNHHIKDIDRSTPISWSPSPLNSKDKNEISKRSLMMLSDDSDVEVDQENQQPLNIPSLLLRERHNSSPALSGSRKGKSRKRIVESDEDDDEEEEEEPLAVQKRRRQQGKERENLRSDGDETVTGFGPSKAATAAPTLDNLFDDEANDENYDPAREGVAEGLNLAEEEDFDFDEFGDFPFDEIDLDLKTRTTTSTRTRTRSKSKSKSLSPQKRKQKNQDTYSLSNDLFPPDEVDILDDEVGYQVHNHYINGQDSILDKVDKAKRYGGNEEWHIYLIDELDDKWQDFYKNHWRRGVDKLKKSDRNDKNSTRIGAILSEDDEEEERDIRPAKRGTASTSTAKRGGAGGWGWRGRGRGAWRGRSASRVRGGGRGRKK